MDYLFHNFDIGHPDLHYKEDNPDMYHGDYIHKQRKHRNVAEETGDEMDGACFSPSGYNYMIDNE